MIQYLAFYLLCFFLILKSYSPLFHNTFWDTWGLGNFLINLEHQWENAKAYDFLGNFTQSRALGGHPQGIYMISELSAILILFFDLPIIDLFGKYASIKFLFLGFYIFGTFGAFLFFGPLQIFFFGFKNEEIREKKYIFCVKTHRKLDQNSVFC